MLPSIGVSGYSKKLFFLIYFFLSIFGSLNSSVSHLPKLRFAVNYYSKSSTLSFLSSSSKHSVMEFRLSSHILLASLIGTNGVCNQRINTFITSGCSLYFVALCSIVSDSKCKSLELLFLEFLLCKLRIESMALKNKFLVFLVQRGQYHTSKIVLMSAFLINSSITKDFAMTYLSQSTPVKSILF